MLRCGSYVVSDSTIDMAIVMCQYNLYMWVYKLSGPVCSQAGNADGSSTRDPRGTYQQLDADISTYVVAFFKILSEIWISLFALGILLLKSIQFLSKLITSLYFYVQKRIDWALIALFSFLLSFGGSSVDSSKKKSVFKSYCDSGLTRWICSSNNT